MNYEEALNFIHGIPRHGQPPGPSRMKALLELVGNPEKKMKFIHVAGTNGKGSTSTMLSHILVQSGYKTGLFISPFIIDFRERIQINNSMIAPKELGDICGYVRSKWNILNKEGLPPTEFQVVLAIALIYFIRNKCDITVLEAGIGGRNDSTNVIDTPEVAVITSIGLDHTKFLGDTIEQIAREKCGIIKSGGYTVTEPNQTQTVNDIIMQSCVDINNVLVPSEKIEVINYSDKGSNIIYNGSEICIPLIGLHQINNVATVLAAVKALGYRGHNITLDSVCKGIEVTKIPSRIEIIGKAPRIILDGAHNPSGVAELVKSLKLIQYNHLHCIISVSEDKDAQALMNQVLPLCSTVYITEIPGYQRTYPTHYLYSLSQACCDTIVEKNPCDAMQLAISKSEPNDIVLIYGSFFLTSYIRPYALATQDKAL